jgi:hypothetical protein
MAEMLRMGARASVAADQRPLGWSTYEVVTVVEGGGEIAREEVVADDGLVFDVTHFVDLDDGRRLTTEQLGAMSLSVPRGCTVEELHEELREFIFEDDLREVDDNLDESPWDDMLGVLRGAGVAADERVLEALPFVVELDDEVSALLAR